MLVADEQRVAEAGGGDHAGTADLALDERVRDQRGGVHDGSGDVGGADAGLGQQLPDAAAHSVERGRRCGQRLVDDHAAADRIEQHDVGERAADVDRQPPVAVHDAARSVRGGENTSRIQTSLYSSSPMKMLSPCPTVAGAR